MGIVIGRAAASTEAIEVSLYIDRIFGRYCETANYATWAGVHNIGYIPAVHDFDRAPEEKVGIFTRFIGVNNIIKWPDG